MIGTVKSFDIENYSYCVAEYGNKRHQEALEFCKKMNARLPLPRNKLEADKFLEISPSFTHVDARNFYKTANKTDWLNAESKRLENRPVYEWITNINIFQSIVSNNNF